MDTIKWKHPAPQSVPVDEEKPKVFPAPSEIAPPNPELDSDYMDGSVAPYQGANPGCDPDRDRPYDNCIYGSYSYKGGASGTEGENETGMVEGF